MLRRCNECRNEISDLLDTCPVCGKNIREEGKKAWTVMMWLGFLLFVFYIFLSF